MNNLELLIGLVAIALAIFFGLWGFRRSIGDQLSTIKEAVVAIRTTVEKTWDLAVQRFTVSGGTVVRELENLGKVRITAEPAENETSYLVEIEKPILSQSYLVKVSRQTELARKEKELFGKEGNVLVLSSQRMRYRMPCTDPKVCSEFVTYILKWLNSTYAESLKDIKEFEEPILT
jgi:hypothetical protein